MAVQAFQRSTGAGTRVWHAKLPGTVFQGCSRWPHLIWQRQWVAGGEAEKRTLHGSSTMENSSRNSKCGQHLTAPWLEMERRVSTLSSCRCSMHQIPHPASPPSAMQLEDAHKPLDTSEAVLLRWSLVIEKLSFPLSIPAVTGSISVIFSTARPKGKE